MLAAWGTEIFGITEAMKDVMARRDWVWLQTDSSPTPGDSTSVASWAACHALNRELRARNPRIKIGIYGWGAANPQGYSPIYPYVTPEMMLHRNDNLQPLWGAETLGVPPFKMLNVSNQTWRSILINRWVQWLSAPDAVNHPGASYDGLILDSWWPEALADQAQAMAGPGGWAVEGVATVWSWWFSHLAAFTDQLRWALEARGKILLVNGISVGSYPANDPRFAAFGPNRTNLAEYASGVMAEYVVVAYFDETHLFTTLDMVAQAIAKRRLVYLSVWTGLAPGAIPGFTDPGGAAGEQFFLAFSQIVNEPPYTMFSYHDGAPYYWAKNGQPYVWDSPLLGSLDTLGHAVGSIVRDVPAGVVWRPFYGGIVVVNVSGAARAVPLGRAARTWHPTTGALCQPPSFSAPARSGAVLFYA